VSRDCRSESSSCPHLEHFGRFCTSIRGIGVIVKNGMLQTPFKVHAFRIFCAYAAQKPHFLQSRAFGVEQHRVSRNLEGST
jgi:hypothetical protein